MIIDLVEPRQWINHQARAVSEDIQCWQDPPGADDYATFTATSGTVTGLLYTVRVRTHRNGLDLICDCQAGQQQTLCKHVYAVAASKGWIDPDAIARLADEISRDRLHERAVALAQQKAGRKNNRERRLIERKARDALYVGPACGSSNEEYRASWGRTEALRASSRPSLRPGCSECSFLPLSIDRRLSCTSHRPWSSVSPKGV